MATKKITINPTPPAEASPAPAPGNIPAPDANGVHWCTDALGRRIGVKPPNALERLRMARLIGGENQRFQQEATVYFYVTHIGGEDVAKPTTMLQIDAMASKLGDDGLIAISNLMMSISGGAPNVDGDDVKN